MGCHHGLGRFARHARPARLVALWRHHLLGLAYDTIYALQDREDDLRIGVKSSAIFFGEAVPAAVGLFLSAMVVCLVLAGQGSGLRMGYYLVLALLAGLFWWQVQRLKACVTAHTAFSLFQQHVYAGVVILLGIWWGTLDSSR